MKKRKLESGEVICGNDFANITCGSLKMSKQYIGIDPGLKGGIAVITDESKYIHPMPVNENGILVKDLRDIILYTEKVNDKFIIIEKVHAMPKQGVTSMFTFGKGYGAIIAVVEMLGYPYQLVTPQAWELFTGEPMPLTAREAAERHLVTPSMAIVDESGKYPEVKKLIFDEVPF